MSLGERDAFFKASLNAVFWNLLSACSQVFLAEMTVGNGYIKVICKRTFAFFFTDNACSRNYFRFIIKNNGFTSQSNYLRKLMYILVFRKVSIIYKKPHRFSDVVLILKKFFAEVCRRFGVEVCRRNVENGFCTERTLTAKPCRRACISNENACGEFRVWVEL